MSKCSKCGNEVDKVCDSEGACSNCCKCDSGDAKEEEHSHEADSGNIAEEAPKEEGEEKPTGEAETEESAEGEKEPAAEEAKEEEAESGEAETEESAEGEKEEEKDS